MRCNEQGPRWYCGRTTFLAALGELRFVQRRTFDRQAPTRRRDKPHRCRQRSSFHLADRSEEHTSELQSLMRISYAVFCLKKKKIVINTRKRNTQENKKAQKEE